MLNTLLDHGWVASTVAATRYAASGNPQLVPALAAGLLACGNNTASPQHSFDVLEQARVLRESLNLTFEQAAERIIDEFRASRKRLPGLGHPTHKTEDFRAVAIWQIADRVGAAGDGIRQFRAIHARFVEASGRFLPVNIDGALAALGYDLGWTATQTVAIGLLSVLPGLMAHAIEELENLIMIPGRIRSNGQPAPVQNADYAKFAAALAPAGRDCLKASLQKNQDAVTNCTDSLSQACDNCHKVYRDAPQK